MITERRLMELLPAAEAGDWAALRELPLELWPEPLTPAMESTLRALPAEEAAILQTMLDAFRAEPRVGLC